MQRVAIPGHWLDGHRLTCDDSVTGGGQAPQIEDLDRGRLPDDDHQVLCDLMAVATAGRELVGRRAPRRDS
jgi:hypothetical protein